MNSEMILELLTERRRMSEMINAIDVLVTFYGTPPASKSPLDAYSKDINKWAASIDSPDRRVVPAESSP